MQTLAMNDLKCRRGFTLIEMIVVISLITFLGALAVRFVPELLRGENTSRGAQALQGTLFIAKQLALRDRVPHGLRLLREDPANPSSPVRSFQYIRQPPDFTGGSISVADKKVTFQGADLSGGLPDTPKDRLLWPVQPGDFISIQDGEYHRIELVIDRYNLLLASSAGVAVTDRYRIARAPRPVPGEDTLFLPDGVIIDVGRSRITPDGANLDVLFAPSGVVLGPGARDGKIILWVRAANLTEAQIATSAEQSLIVIFTRTGKIAAYPVDTSKPPSDPTYDPYAFTRDPRASGL